jgi:hypothetical protein
MKKLLYTALTLSPVLAFAQTVATVEGNVKGLLGSVKNIINALFPVLMALAVLYFFWGLVNYVKSAGDEKARDAGKGQMIWGIIALFIMVSLFGILAWVQSATGLTQGTSISPIIITQ